MSAPDGVDRRLPRDRPHGLAAREPERRAGSRDLGAGRDAATASTCARTAAAINPMMSAKSAGNRFDQVEVQHRVGQRVELEGRDRLAPRQGKRFSEGRERAFVVPARVRAARRAPARSRSGLRRLSPSSVIAAPAARANRSSARARCRRSSCESTSLRRAASHEPACPNASTVSPTCKPSASIVRGPSRISSQATGFRPLMTEGPTRAVPSNAMNPPTFIRSRAELQVATLGELRPHRPHRDFGGRLALRARLVRAIVLARERPTSLRSTSGYGSTASQFHPRQAGRIVRRCVRPAPKVSAPMTATTAIVSAREAARHRHGSGPRTALEREPCARHRRRREPRARGEPRERGRLHTGGALAS